MIFVNELSKSFGATLILNEISFNVSDGEKIGLVGPNGTGKSTLLKLIADIESPDAGTAGHNGGELSYLKQDVPFESTNALLEELWVAFDDITSLQQKIDTVSNQISEGAGNIEELINEQASLFTELEILDGYRVEKRIGRVLDGLGFTQEDRKKKCGDFSGGWKMRIGLAKVLVRQPEHLLLDEPTNHLDTNAKTWLTQYLFQFPGTVILVTHDRDFLDGVAARIVELRDGIVTSYLGNYSSFLKQKASKLAQLQKTAAQENREIAKQERFIERFRSKATKATQVKSREKSLQKINRTILPNKEKKISFQLKASSRVEREVLQVEGLGHSWDNRTVLVDANLLVERGQKIVLVGPNGSGKSTFLRALSGEFIPTEGTISWSERAEPAYYDQHQDEVLDLNLSVLDEVKSVALGKAESEIRKALGQFLFRGDTVYKSISVLSGGERSRVALAKFLLKPSNVLLLDEPTNHLDVMTRKMIIEALSKYEGTIVCASHDNLLMHEVATRVIQVEDGECVELSRF